MNLPINLIDVISSTNDKIRVVQKVHLFLNLEPEKRKR